MAKNQNCQHATMHDQSVEKRWTVVFTALAYFLFSVVFLQNTLFVFVWYSSVYKPSKFYFHMAFTTDFIVCRYQRQRTVKLKHIWNIYWSSVTSHALGICSYEESYIHIISYMAQVTLRRSRYSCVIFNGDFFWALVWRSCAVLGLC